MYNNPLRRLYLKCYSLGPEILSSFLACSLMSRRSIFPLGDFGTWSTNRTPPRSFLCGATCFASHSARSWALLSLGSTPAFRTTYARGTSVACSLSSTPITHTSTTSSCPINRPSSSAGGTGKPSVLLSATTAAAGLGRFGETHYT